jgi:hypothetical protein
MTGLEQSDREMRLADAGRAVKHEALLFDRERLDELLGEAQRITLRVGVGLIRRELGAGELRRNARVGEVLLDHDRSPAVAARQSLDAVHHHAFPACAVANLAVHRLS